LKCNSPSRLFAIAYSPAPILNTPDFQNVFGGKNGSSLLLDEKGLLRAIETVALSDTKFEILEECGTHIVRVKTRDYAGDSLFVDRRFLKAAEPHAPERCAFLPQPHEILERMKTLLGLPYVWGGNFPGIPLMTDLYPPKASIDESLLKIWTFQGVDCSGLLYWATNGYTPRNTSQLVHYGKSLAIEGLSPPQIIKLLRPLDLLVWKGHVVIVASQEETIESLAGFGVISRDLYSRLDEICKERNPKNSWDPALQASSFVVNRWIL
jgi:cell wall-associated NlpC family hydrolase